MEELFQAKPYSFSSPFQFPYSGGFRINRKGGGGGGVAGGGKNVRD